MAPPRQRNKPSKSLSAGRPTSISKSKSTVSNLSSFKSRQLIRSHHELSKAHAQAVAGGDEKRASDIAEKLEAQGGLERYQEASKAGQCLERGGDSSLVLIQWLKPLRNETPKTKLKMLEVGALSTGNACSQSGLFDVTRIDLNSQSKGILKQDFMERPLPVSDNQCFDCVSLSLVLNYVPDPVGRGDMLKRVIEFLKRPSEALSTERPASLQEVMPSLFLVLPAPCVTNSRYLNETKLEAMLETLGFSLVFRKLTPKLIYYLFVHCSTEALPKPFAKEVLSSGGSRNNFAVVVKGS